MVFWGSYTRDLRTPAGDCRVRIPRQRCPACGISHAILPEFVTYQRLDEVASIGRGIEAMAAGTGCRTVAGELGLPHTTVRDWRRRFRERAGLLAQGIAAAVVALTGMVPRLDPDPGRAALGAMAAAWRAAKTRGRIVGSAFHLANALCGSHLLSTNTHPPWALA